jgi:tetratricopeptide (TPR) repeat protein
MDMLDKISVSAVAVLLIASFAVIRDHGADAERDIHTGRRPPAAAAVLNKELDEQLKSIKKLIEADNLTQAEILASELIARFPFQGEPHMAMGDLLMRRQDPVKAMHEYKQAIDFNPDYLDKKTPLFQGKKLKSAAGEASSEIENRLRRNPEDESLKSERKVIYYLYRKIAGSCG